MIEHHVQLCGVRFIRHDIVNTNGGLAERAGNGAPQFEVGTKDARFFYHGRYAHIEPACHRVWLDYRFDLGRDITDPAMEAVLAVGRAHAREAAGGKQAAAERGEPFDAAMAIGRGALVPP